MGNRDELFPFTRHVVDEIADVMHKQDLKGIAKYNQKLDPNDSKYDWLEMASEELADALKYFKAEQVKRDNILSDVFEMLEELQEHGRVQEDTFLVYKVEYIKLQLDKINPIRLIK